MMVRPRKDCALCHKQQRDHCDLPNDILVYIFSLCSHGDIARCSAVCRQWRQASEDESLWRTITVKIRTRAEFEQCVYVCRRAGARLRRVRVTDRRDPYVFPVASLDSCPNVEDVLHNDGEGVFSSPGAALSTLRACPRLKVSSVTVAVKDMHVMERDVFKHWSVHVRTQSSSRLEDLTSFPRMQNITRIDIERHTEIDECILQCANVKHIHITACSVRNAGILVRMKALRTLSACSTLLEDNGLEEVIATGKLRHLNVQSLRTRQLQYLCSALARNRSLQTLVLSFTTISVTDLVQVARTIDRHENIRAVSISALLEAKAFRVNEVQQVATRKFTLHITNMNDVCAFVSGQYGHFACVFLRKQGATP